MQKDRPDLNNLPNKMITTKPSLINATTLSSLGSGIHPSHSIGYVRRSDIIETKLDDPRAAPFRANPSDAGADLYSKLEVAIYPGEQKMIDTGVSLKIPSGFVGYVFNRSSQGKLGVQIANGTGIIDSDYRGNIKVLLKNTGTDPYFVYPYATRIAQLVISPVVLATFEVSKEITNWEDTARGTGGFGSTGG